MNPAEGEGRAQLQDDQQACELQHRYNGVRGEEANQEAQGSEGEGAGAVASGE